MPFPRITVVGGVIADPDLRFTNSGKAVATLRLILKDRKRDGDTWVDTDPIFLRCVVFSPLAEHVAETVSKGDDVIVQGRLQANKWTTKDGEERYDQELIADDFGVSCRWKAWKALPREQSERGGISAEQALANAGFAQDDSAPPF